MSAPPEAMSPRFTAAESASPLLKAEAAVDTCWIDAWAVDDAAERIWYGVGGGEGFQGYLAHKKHPAFIGPCA